MDRNSVRDKYAKAIIEELNPDLPLHMSLLEPDRGRSDVLCYMKIFEEPGKAMQLAEAVVSGETLVRKLHRIRNKELVKFIEEDFEGLKDIHVISEATIGVIADAESNLLSHSFLDLVGTVEEVKLAEELILDKVLKTYSSVCYPVILMIPKICWDKMYIPLHTVCRVLGTYGSNLLRIEMESGAWIKIEQGPSPGVWEWERVVNVFGPRENVNKAKSLIQSVISDQPGELSALQALNEFLNQFKEPTFIELIDHKKYADGESEQKKKQKVGEANWSQTFLRNKKSEGCKQTTEGDHSEEKKKQHEFKEPIWSQTFGRIISCRWESDGEKETKEAKDKEFGELQAEEGGSGVTEKEKQDPEGDKQTEEAKDTESGEVEKEKQQKDIEEAFAAQEI